MVAAIRAAAPGLADAALLWWPSASSCIWQGEREVRGIRGQRLWMLAGDAADIPRAGAVLRDRLWLAGHGCIEVSKSGALLERTLIDASVWQPSRLDFAGGAACSGGLDQRRGDPVTVPGAIEVIDTRAALPDLTDAVRTRLAELKAEARTAAAPDAHAAREEWIAARVAEMLAEGKRDDPETVARAEASARRALDGGVLAGDFILHVEIAGRVEAVSVEAALDDRMRYHGLSCHDPLEPKL